MTRRRAVAVVAAALVLVLAAVVGVVACSGTSATSRLQRMFRLEDVGSADAIRSGLLAKVPVGTPAAEVVAFLDRSGVGADGLSSRHGPDEEGRLVCRIELDPSGLALVKESYGIVFLIDGGRGLRDVHVQRWLTGP